MFRHFLSLESLKYSPKLYSPIKSKIIGLVSAAVGVVIAAGLGLYSFAGFSPQATNNIPLPNNPLIPNLENVDRSSSPDNVDQVAVDRLINEEGLDIDTATFLAEIGSEIKTSNSTYLNYIQTLSDQVVWDVQIKAIPDQTYVPTDAELQAAAATGSEIYDASYSFEEIDGIPQFTLRYFVPYEAMSEDLKASIKSSNEPSTSAAMIGLLPAADASDGASGAVIVTIIKNLIREGAGSKFGSVFGALDAAVGAYKLKESRSYFSELDQLRECAENPTNPLTKKTYQENPSEKAKVTDQIDEAQSQLDQLTAARMLNLAAKTGSKFIPGLNFAGKLFFDSVAKWNDETLKQVSERWVDDARKAVVKCEPAATRLNGSIKYSVSTGQVYSDDCNSYTACYEIKEQQSGSGAFFVQVVSNFVSGNGTGSYEGTRTKVITGTPNHPLQEYNGEYDFVTSGDIQIVVQGTTPVVAEGFHSPGTLTVNGAGLLTEEGSSTNYVADYGDTKVHPVRDEIHRETTGGFVCHFEDIDFVKGGKYTEDIIRDGTVAGTCEMVLTPE